MPESLGSLCVRARSLTMPSAKGVPQTMRVQFNKRFAMFGGIFRDAPERLDEVFSRQIAATACG